MDAIINFITQGSTVWTPDLFFRGLLVFTALEGIFSICAVCMYVGKRF